jgi:hypothetical protein
MALSSTLEKNIHRKNTLRFINADPTTIVLKTQGGSVVDGTVVSGAGFSREPQQFKLIWGEQSGIFRETPDGARRFDFILLGVHDATVEIGDTFSIGDNKYVITYIYPYNDYEVKAGGVSHGSNPGNT